MLAHCQARPLLKVVGHPHGGSVLTSVKKETSQARFLNLATPVLCAWRGIFEYSLLGCISGLWAMLLDLEMGTLPVRGRKGAPLGACQLETGLGHPFCSTMV